MKVVVGGIMICSLVLGGLDLNLGKRHPKSGGIF